MAELRTVLTEAIRDGNPYGLTRNDCVAAVLPVVERYLATSRAEAERQQADAKQWHDTYQQSAGAFDQFLADLLELLPEVENTGSDAYDQIPRGIKGLRAEVERLRATEQRVRDLADQLDSDSAEDTITRDQHIEELIKRDVPEPRKNHEAARLDGLIWAQRDAAQSIREALGGDPS